MKSAFLLLPALIILAGCTSQPSSSTPPTPVALETSLPPDKIDKIKERVASYQARLQLSVAQADRIRPLLKSELVQFSNVYSRLEAATSHSERVSLLQEARQIQEETDADVRPMLNDAQKQEWQKIRDERREEIRAEFQSRHAGADEIP